MPAPARCSPGDVLREQHKLQVVRALTKLIRETGEVPTADVLAERAQVSRRSVFRLFFDRAALIHATFDYMYGHMLEQFDSFDGEVQVRAHGDTYPAQIWMDRGVLRIRVQTPISGLAPGQSAVVYLGTRVVGQCTVDQTVSADDTVSAGASAAAESSLSGA
jgi:AcrR family transcriptional regulator